MDEGVRLRELERGPLSACGMAQRERNQGAENIPQGDVQEDRRSAPVDGRDRSDYEPDQPLRADVRERDEEVVEPAHAVMDDPALEPGVEVDYGAARGVRLK